MSKELEERLRKQAEICWESKRVGTITKDRSAIAMEKAAATLKRYREALERIAKCEASMNGHIARQALDAVEGETND